MSRLIESIRVFNGGINNLASHTERMHRACTEVLSMRKPWDLEDVLAKTVIPSEGLFKCRVVYDEANVSVEFSPYKPRTINSLKIIRDDSISYSHKFANRQRLDAHFQNKGACDDILIVRNSLVTDSSNANIVFNRKGEWVTPASCLLRGTMRKFLLDAGQLRESEIRVEDIPEFQSFRPINAMIQDQAPEMPIDSIFY